TELAPRELPGHSGFFGRFAIEFDLRAATELGAVPLFYVPRIASRGDYGVGPAIVTPLAHVQGLIDRLSDFRSFADAAMGAMPTAPLIVHAVDGGLVVEAQGTAVTITLPRELIERIRRHNT